jgi:hypothetical protein
MTRDDDVVALLREKYEALAGVLDERSRRRWAAVEATSLGYGGESWVSAATGISRPTIRAGKAELASGEDLGDRIRRPGAGRPSLEEKQPGIREALEKLVDPLTRGDPESPLRWTSKSKEKLSAALSEQGYLMSATRVGLRLHEMGYSLRSVRKTREGSSHPDRNAQFEHINATAEEYQRRNQPVISVDTKKKELVGDFRNGGKEWQPKGSPEKVLVHDFPGGSIGKAIPYSVYDMARNEAWVSVGRDHDTPKFAVASIRQWWKRMGARSYPSAKDLFITADAGGSNGYRSRAWKVELQALADEIGLRIRVSHFPPGTSKWNKIEHRLFCHITQNWRGKPLRTWETVVELIGRTRTSAGLRVNARLDKRRYPTGTVVSNAAMQALALREHVFHGDWNYAVAPRKLVT